MEQKRKPWQRDQRCLQGEAGLGGGYYASHKYLQELIRRTRRGTTSTLCTTFAVGLTENGILESWTRR